MTDKNIILIGFMGSGKTSIGKRLSKNLKREFIDMDDFISQKMSMSVSEIFQVHGEKYFRKLESDLCKRFSKSKRKIIATGGGIIKSVENTKNLKKGGIIIYLQSDPEKIAYNLRNDNTRPLLDVDDKLQKIQELMSERAPMYEKCADITINVSELDLEDTLSIILDKLEQSPKKTRYKENITNDTNKNNKRT